MTHVDYEKMKIIAARKALEYVKDGYVLGIGSGSTVKYFIEFLGDALKKGLLKDIIGIPSSIDSRILMSKYGIPITDLYENPEIDLTVDGADSILSDKGVIIKGLGGAFTREKIINYAAKKRIIIVDERKLNREVPVPIEVLPFSLGYVIKTLDKMGGKPILRESSGKVGPCISDNGNIILDAYFEIDQITPTLEIELNKIPGVLENGVFVMQCEVIVGLSSNEIKILRI